MMYSDAVLERDGHQPLIMIIRLMSTWRPQSAPDLLIFRDFS